VYHGVSSREENKAMMNKRWEDATITERQEIVDSYNRYYNNEKEPISFDQCDWAWTGRNFYTIKYTFGQKPF
jgi:hypothetical protein